MSEFRFTWHNTMVGAPVWAPCGGYGWRAGVVARLGRTHVHLAFEGKDGRVKHGRRRYEELRRRDPKARGADKPRPLDETALLGLTSDPVDVVSSGMR